MMFIPNKKQTLLISGPAGDLELLLSSPENPKNLIGVICHPHPVQGGTMHNKVVYTLASAMESLGVKTVRFNFRGVQKSEGEFDQGRGELADLITVVEWVKTHSPNDGIWLAGFSFGAYIAIKGHRICEAERLIAVAPPAGHPYFNDLPQIACPWTLVQGETDEVVEADKVLSWGAAQVLAPQLLIMPETGHFFHGQLVILKEKLVSFLR